MPIARKDADWGSPVPVAVRRTVKTHRVRVASVESVEVKNTCGKDKGFSRTKRATEQQEQEDSDSRHQQEQQQEQQQGSKSSNRADAAWDEQQAAADRSMHKGGRRRRGAGKKPQRWPK
jgi:hypothetical protein